MNEAIDMVNRIAAAATMQEVWSLTVAAVQARGFERVNYGLTRGQVGRSIGDPTEVLFLSTHALDRVIEHHTSGRYLKTPEYRWVLDNVGAVSWGWTREQMQRGALSAAELDAISTVGARRERAGYSISFAENLRRMKGAMGLAAPAGISQSVLDLAWAKVGAEVLAICNMAHFKICQMPLPVPGADLPPRQREILEWIADGKSLQDVVVLTGLSLSSIEKALRRARETLSVETNAQAVAKLAFLNQLFVTERPEWPLPERG